MDSQKKNIKFQKLEKMAFICQKLLNSMKLQLRDKIALLQKWK